MRASLGAVAFVFLLSSLALVAQGCPPAPPDGEPDGGDGDTGACAEASAPDASIAPDGGIECPPGDYLYRDFIGGPPQSGIPPSPPEPYGDLRCYHLCTDDRDCTDPCFPHCGQLGLFAGGDNYCNEIVHICRPPIPDECPWK